MRKTYRILPVYTGDVSGAASALYEFGGMTVIHDPSGCNSTYNTHDETRWFDKESLIYISGLNDIDAITGNDDKFISDICASAERMKPRFIALANSPLPYLNGTDFKGICRILEEKTGLPCFYVNTNAMHDYSKGQSEAFLGFAKKMLRAPEKKIPNGVNVIGMTPLDLTSTKISLSDSYETVSNWGLNTSYDEVIRATEAGLNIAVSSSGIAACRYMEEEYGIPYIKGLPWEGRPLDYMDVERRHSKNYIVGEPVISGSIAAYLKIKTGIDYNVIAATEITDGLLLDCDRKCHGEEELEEALKDADNIIADPMIRLISPSKANFIELPHFALSGRLYLKKIPDLLDPGLYYHGI